MPGSIRAVPKRPPNPSRARGGPTTSRDCRASRARPERRGDAVARRLLELLARAPRRLGAPGRHRPAVRDRQGRVGRVRRRSTRTSTGAIAGSPRSHACSRRTARPTCAGSRRSSPTSRRAARGGSPAAAGSSGTTATRRTSAATGAARTSRSCTCARRGARIDVDAVRVPYNGHTTRYPARVQAVSSQYGGGVRRDRWEPNPLGAKPRDVLEIPVICNGMAEKTDARDPEARGADRAADPRRRPTPASSSSIRSSARARPRWSRSGSAGAGSPATPTRVRRPGAAAATGYDVGDGGTLPRAPRRDPREFPGFRLVKKHESAFQRVIHGLLAVVTLGGQRSYLDVVPDHDRPDGLRDRRLGFAARPSCAT